MACIKNAKIAETKIENNIQYRKCTKCDTWFTLDNFYSKCKNNPNWIDSVCKTCRKSKSIKRQIEKHDDILQKQRNKKLELRGIQSPFNYMGNKYLILQDIIDLFPKNINKFIDLFCGSATVGVNLKANEIICNDVNKDMINFYNNCLKLKYENMINQIQSTIAKYNLNENNIDNFQKIRNDFNNGLKDWYVFYTLVTYSFNQNPLYNQRGKYNSSYGKGKCNFNSMLQKRLNEFLNQINNINIKFTNFNYKDFNFDNLTPNDFVYIDPPYLISSKTYEWNINEETKLLDLLDKLNSMNIKFALSNVLEHKGKSNDMLKQWAKKYNIHHLNRNYARMHRGKIKDTNSIEVLITNY